MKDNAEYKIKSAELRRRVAENGFSTLNDEELLELVLSYTLPNKDSKELSGKLLKYFGSLPAIMDAPKYMLMDIGLPSNTTLVLKMISKISCIYLLDKYFNPEKKEHKYKIEEKIYSSFMGCDGEQVIMVLFDGKGNETYFKVISKGSVGASEIYVRKIIDTCIRYRASKVYLAHNHPSGISFPSKKDVEATIKVRDALRAVNIELADHFIVGSSEAFSMANNKNFKYLFK